MKPHKPRLIEIPENVSHIMLMHRRGESLTPVQQEVLTAWQAQGFTSALDAFNQRPWRRGDKIVFRDVTLGSLSKQFEASRARKMQ